jgi:hypothetical protein
MTLTRSEFLWTVGRHAFYLVFAGSRVVSLLGLPDVRLSFLAKVLSYWLLVLSKATRALNVSAMNRAVPLDSNDGYLNEA